MAGARFALERAWPARAREKGFYRDQRSTHDSPHLSVALGSRNKLIISISTPLRAEWTGPRTTCLFWARWKNSSETRILARRKGVLGVVLRALYDYGASRTRIQCSEISFFWPPPGHARGGWRESHGRCARGECVAWSLQRTLPQTIYPVSRA